MIAERRHSPRQILDSLLYLDLEPHNGGIVLDLSEAGMQISVANPLLNVQEIQFSLCLEAQKRVRGKGRVIWVAASGKNAGVSFLPLPDETLDQLRKFLGQVATGGGGDTVLAQSADPNSPAEAPLLSPPPTGSQDPPTLLSLYDREGFEGVPPAQAGTAEAETRAGETDSLEAPRSAAHATSTDSAGEQPPLRFFLDRFPKRPVRPAPKVPSPPPSVPPAKAAAAQPSASQPAARVRAKSPDGAGKRSPEGARPKQETGTSASPQPLRAGALASATSPGRQLDGPLPTGGPLYMPNYQADENRKTGDVRLSKFDLQESYHVALKLAFERLEEFGWALEHDWHLWVALILLLGGFLGLAHKPPLPILTIALWVACAVFMLGRKKSKDTPAD